MRYILLLFLTCYSYIILAQSIHGFVYVKDDNTPVAYASVALKSLPDSGIVSGGITLMDGKYTFNGIPAGTYSVEIHYMGYQPASVEVTVEPGHPDVAADTMFLEVHTHDIDEVIVKAERLQGKEMVDRTVYEVPEEVAGLSNTGYDLLRLVPQVQVDFQNNVTLNGSSNFIIEVDGKQRDKEFLARLEPSDISRIEIITNPSGKYEGNIDGVLSIILKKEARIGVSGNLSAFVKPFNKPTAVASGSIDYGLGNVTFYATAFTFVQQLNMLPYSINRYPLIDSLNITDGTGDININSTSFNGGMDWYVNDYNHLSLNLNTRPINQEISNNTITNSLSDDQLVQNLFSDHETNMHSNEFSTSLFYKRTYKKPVKEFTTEATWYTFGMNDKNIFSDSVASLTTPVNYNENRTEKNDNKRSYYSIKINYVQPVGLAAKIETGYQLYMQQIQYDFDQQIDLFGFQDTSGNVFKYAEWRNAIYGGYTMNVKKIGIQAVVRVEHSLNQINKLTDTDYFTFLPSANIQYKFSASKNLKLTYNRRIDRPGIYDLNPAQKISAQYTLSEGNPYLEPGLKDRVQLTFTWNFNKNYLSPYVYYLYLSEQKGTINTIVEAPYDNSTTILSKPFNIRTGNETGGGLNAMLWYVNINASIYQGIFDEYQNNLATIPSYKYSSYRVQSSAFYKFEKIKFTTFVFLQYNGVSIESQTKNYSAPIYGLGAQKEFEKHNIGFFWLLPFSETITFRKTITETRDFYSRNDMAFDLSWFIQFIYSYKFNKGKAVKKIKPKIDVESDSKSEGIGR